MLLILSSRLEYPAEIITDSPLELFKFPIKPDLEVVEYV
jgi:hypothetical protein